MGRDTATAATYYLNRGVQILRSEGPLGLLGRLWTFLRRRRWRTVEFNGVAVMGKESVPEYESGIVDALGAHVRADDTVVVVGGGWGVTAVHAARQAGTGGRVVVYEGSPVAATRSRSTAELNGVADRVSVRTALVGPAISVADSGGEAEAGHVDPADLPACDVLELDCEGAELEILREMECEPRTVIVETHGNYGAPPEAVEDALESRGYEVVSRELAERRLAELCAEKGIYVLTARRAE